MGFNTTVPMRFLVSIAHMMAAIMALYSKADNVRVGLRLNYADSEFNSADRDVTAALVLILIFIVVDFVGMCGGFTMFFGLANVIQIVFHSIGAIVLSFFIIETWDYRTIWTIWGWCSFVPTFFEVLAILSVLLFKVHRY